MFRGPAFFVETTSGKVAAVTLHGDERVMPQRSRLSTICFPIIMDIRPVHITDAKAVTALIHELGYHSTEDDMIESIHRCMRSDDAFAYVALDGDLPVGVVSLHRCPYFHRPGSLLRITSLVVAESSKRRGVGRLLIDYAVEIARSEGCDRIELTSSQHRDQEAHRFYRSCGFYEYDGVRFLKDIV